MNGENNKQNILITCNNLKLLKNMNCIPLRSLLKAETKQHFLCLFSYLTKLFPP